ncbi:MAG TPA: TRAP transporter substrate-binding protein [Syntrophorhabdaceae bacterium]|nr:TRAP transporter substrate-binding protein [Syntrophorhabdaceae bacterium]
MRRRMFLVALFTVTLYAGGFVPCHAQGTAPIKLKFSNFQPITFSATPVIGQFCEEIKKRTNGRVEITYYPGGTLTTAAKVYDGIVNHVSDLGNSHTAYTRGRFPLSEMLDLPVGYTSGFVCTHVKHDFYKKYKPKEWNEVHVLYFWSPGPQIFATSKKAFHTMDDLKGLKFRGMGRPADTIKAIGAVPVSLEMGDAYDAAQRGLLDGMFETMETWKGFRLGDVIKYAALTQRATGLVYTFYVAMNKEKWDALPGDIKKIFDETSEEFVDKHAVTTLSADFEGLDYFKQRGGQMISLPEEEIQKMRKAVEPVIQNYMKDMEAKGFKKDEMEAQLQYIYERITYWGKQERDRKLKSPYVQ